MSLRGGVIDDEAMTQKNIMSEMIHREHHEASVSYEVAEALPKNAERIAHIQEESWCATYPNTEINLTEQDVRKKFSDTKKRVERWQTRIEKPMEGVRISVIKENDRIIGFCVVEKGKTQNHVEALYLDPSFRGKHAGSTVFRDALAWLGDDKSTVLEVASYNDRAIDFYKRFGFEDAGKGESLKVIDDKFIPITSMRRSEKL